MTSYELDAQNDSLYFVHKFVGFPETRLKIFQLI